MAKTKDFYIACFLLARGLRLARLERTDKGPFVFVFDGEAHDVAVLIGKYWDRSVSVDARAFVEAINELKTRMYT